MKNWQRIILLPVALLSLNLYAQGMPEIVQAAKEADWERLQLLIAGEGNVNSLYGDGASALHWASYHNKIDSALALLVGGAQVNASTDLGVTPLWLAAENGSTSMVAALLKAGASPQVALYSGETLLMTAAHSGNANVVRQLLAAGASVQGTVTRGQTALMWAAGQGHSEVVQVLLEYGANVNARTKVHEQYVKSEKEQDSHPAYKTWVELGGNTPLMFAARSADLRSAQLLVAAGSDVNGLSAFGTSPAIMAVHGGNAELLGFLLDSGADVNSASSGHTALHAAVLRGNYGAVEVLLNHGAEVDAILQSSTPTRRQSADYNFHDALIGATPLWLAARFTEPEIMALLLEHEADSQVVNDMTYPALRGGQPVITEEGEISLLMAAVGMGYRRLRMSWGSPERRAGIIGQDSEARILETVQVAAQAGAKLGLVNAAGQSALDYAEGRGYDFVARYLKTKNISL